MEDISKFDDIRPYNDEEVAPVIKRLLNNPQFREVVNSYLFPGKQWEQVEALMQTFNSQFELQHTLIKDIVFQLLNRTASCTTCTGMENIPRDKACTYISNHRDIVLDASLLSVLLANSNYNTVEIAIGDNLLLSEWIRDVVRLNKCFIVKRNVSMHQMLETSRHLSEYIHYTIRDKNQSIWIAQREGRAKDSNDRTQEGLLKMLAMGSNQEFLNSLMELNLTAVTFSYEYDPCDFLKAKEFQQKRDNPEHKKTPEDDAINMKTGILGYKGSISLKFGHSINSLLSNLDNSLGRNELVTQVASIIDNEIFRNYHFYPVNYIAYDRLWGENTFQYKYTEKDIDQFDNYFRQQLDKIDLPNKDIPYLMERMEEMYAYPLKNYLSTENND